MNIFRLFLLLLLLSVSARAQVVISEFMAANVNTTIVDEDGSHQDWLELQNNGASTVSLNGWYLTDDITDLRKWQFPLTTPAVSLAPGARLLVWCSSKNRKSSITKLHTNFKLDSAGEYLALVQSNGLTVAYQYNAYTQLDGSKTYPPQATDVAYGISGGRAWNVLSGPTLNSLWRVRVPQDATEFTTTIAGWNTNTGFVDTGWTQKMLTVIGGVSKGLGYNSSGSGGSHGYLVNYTATPNGVLAANTDVGAATYGLYSPTFPVGTPTLCARTTFTVADKTTIQSLRLNIKYDDGFIAYLNGTEVLRSNAPTTAAWNSASTIDREDNACEEFETFTLAGAQSLLVNGTNLLSIHAFNSARNAQQLILNPSLEAYQTLAGATSGTVGYLSSATPGGENATSSVLIGPDIAQTTQNPTLPDASTSAPFPITARVRQTLGTIASVQLRYVRMFDQAYGSEPTITMLDNGTGGDLLAGDGIYTAEIPAAFMATLGASQMLRWRVVATDAAGNVSNDPPYRDTYDNDQYFGTMARDGVIQNLLPTMFWFHNSSSTAPVFSDTEGGFRSSFYFKLQSETTGRFYDNVRVTLHGQSTASFPKKSQNINFNSDNKFKWRDGEKLIGGMNFLSNWADKSHVRNPVMWDLWNRTRHPSHFCQTVRVQQITATATAGQGNVGSGVDAQFLCLTDMVEDGNSDFLQRWGLDPDGALYKCYNSLENASQNSSTNGGGVEKKTRQWDDFSDIAALETAMNTSNTVSARRQWLYDNVDVPGLINFLAVHNLAHSHDFGHKNYYMYRDTLGSGEWTPLPWDQDLSFGHRWTSYQNYFDDDLESASTIFSGGGGNRLMNVIIASGATELTQMYVRRLRSLADQYYGPTAAPVSILSDNIDSFLNYMDPPGWPVLTDAERDFQKWGFWIEGTETSDPNSTAASSGSTTLTAADSRAPYHRIRASALRIKSTNDLANYPGQNPYCRINASTQKTYGATANLNSSVNAFANVAVRAGP